MSCHLKLNMSSIKLSCGYQKDTKARHLLGKPTHDDDVIMHLCALGDPLGRGGKGGEGDSQVHTLCQVA